jgi:hypothetical protein
MASDGHGFASPGLSEYSRDRLAGNEVDFPLVGIGTMWAQTNIRAN